MIVARLCCFCLAGSAALPALAVGPSNMAAPEPASLSRQAPADVRIFLEVRDWRNLLASPAGASLARALEDLSTTAPAPVPVSSQPSAVHAAQPAGRLSVSWRDRLTHQIGLTQPGLIDLITAGRLAVAADGWRSLGDAVLIAQPTQVPQIEALLAPQLIPASDPLSLLIPANSQHPIRRFRLANDHELASDGKFVLIGRRQSPGGLYARTLALWNSEHGVALSDTADYRERTVLLAPQPQALVYVSGQSRQGAGSALPALVWPAEWNKYQSLAASLRTSPEGAVVDLTGYPGDLASRNEPRPNLPLLSKLPASTLLVWTHTIDYAAEYHRISGQQNDATIAFYREVLGAGMPPGTIEQDLFSHLTGDTLFVLSQVARPSTHPAAGGNVLWIPAFTIAVQVNDMDRVSGLLQRIFTNFLGLLNVRPASSGPLRMERLPIGPGGGEVWNVAVGRLLANVPGSEILGQLQLSWAVADGFLIVGTASESVRELILARRSQAPLLAQAPVAASAARTGFQTILLAQPVLISDLVSSWAGFLRENPSALIRPEWWAQLQSVRTVSLTQLGVIPGPAQIGSVPIARVLPELPAGSRLRPGDVVLGVDGRSLAANDSLGSLEFLLATRPRRAGVSLRVRRAGQEIMIELPIPQPTSVPSNSGPVEFLSQASRVLRLFGTARYSVAYPSPDVFTSRLELQFAPIRPLRP